MKTKEEMLEVLREEVESSHESKIEKLRIEQKYALNKKFAKSFLRTTLFVLVSISVSIVGISLFKPEITLVYTIFSMGIYVVCVFVFVFFLNDKLVEKYVERRLVLPAESIDVDAEVKELVGAKINDLTNEVFDLDLAVSEAKIELGLLEEIQREKT